LAAALAGGLTVAQLLLLVLHKRRYSRTTANQTQTTFLANNVQLSDGTYIAKTDFNTLSAADQHY